MARHEKARFSGKGSLILSIFVAFFLSALFVTNVFAQLMDEDFEDGVLDPRISVLPVGTFNSAPMIKDITNFGSTKAFGFGISTCRFSCFTDHMSTLKIEFPSPTYVSTLSFKEMELYSNWGSLGRIYVDGVYLTGDPEDVWWAHQDLGRLPYNDWTADPEYRLREFTINAVVSTIEFKVFDITNASEIFIDDLRITGQDICTPPPSGMVSWWKAEDNADDSVGTNHGTLMNGVTFEEGKVGQSFSFDGVNNYVEVPDAPTLNFGDSDFTIDLWFKIGAFAGEKPMIAKRAWNVPTEDGYSIGLINSNTVRIHAYSDIDLTTAHFNDNQWHHIALVIHKASNTYDFYLDNVKQSGSITTATQSNNYALRIGSNSGATIYYRFPGQIDEVSIFNRSLTAEEIAAIYNAGSAGKCDIQRTLTVTKSGTGTGTVTSNPAGVNCGVDCSEVYTSGTIVTLSPAPDTGSTFAGWSGHADCSDGSVTMDANKTCTATFNLIQRTLTVTKSGTGTGTVAAGANCTLTWGGAGNNTGTCTVNDGTAITLSGSANADSTWNGWSGGTGSASACTGTGPCAFNITADSAVAATFTINQYTVTPSAGPNGTIAPNTPQMVNHGSTTTFTVTPAAGYTASVGGTCGGTLVGNTYTTNAITGNCTVAATFTLNQYTVTPSAGPNGTITPNTPQTVNHGSTTQFTVTPNAGYTAAVGGTCGGTLSGNTYTTNPITANCTVAATFTLAPSLPDLIILALTAPATARAGTNISITDTTRNNGPGAAGASTTRFYLSTNATLDALDTVLGSRAVPALGAGASSTVTTSVPIPGGTARGTYYIIARADTPTNVITSSAIAETNENNNTRNRVIRIWSWIWIRIWTDLVVSSLTAPATAGAGTNISITDTTRNNGPGAAGASTTRFYLSTNAILDAGDTLLDVDDRAVPALAAGASSTGTTSVTIPGGTAGTYYIIARADDLNVVVETNENNNTRNRVIQISP